MRLFFLLVFAVNYAFGQTIDKYGRTIEQNALDYLICNLPTIELPYEKGCFHFNPDSNKIWYRRIAWAKRDIKVRIPKAFRASEDEFFYAACDKKDIYIMTNAYKEFNSGYSVDFYIVTHVNHYIGYTVLIDMDLVPYKILDDTFNTGHAGKTCSCEPTPLINLN